MTSLPDTITLGPDEEARRLWSAATAAMKRAGEDLIALCEALDLGLRAAEILLVQRLQPVKARFPATIVAQLETPDAEVDVLRDAISAPKAIAFTDLLDLLSDESLDCVGPRLHRGWEDRRFACARSRKTAHQALGFALTERERSDLLVLSAYRNRIFRHPPPIRIETTRVIEAFPSLNSLVERLG